MAVLLPLFKQEVEPRNGAYGTKTEFDGPRLTDEAKMIRFDLRFHFKGGGHTKTCLFYRFGWGYSYQSNTYRGAVSRAV
jgi:hypothetical protein